MKGYWIALYKKIEIWIILKIMQLKQLLQLKVMVENHWLEVVNIKFRR